MKVLKESKILILTNSEDATSDYFEECLRNMSISVARYNTDKDLLQTNFKYFNYSPIIEWDINQLTPNDVSAVIFRRPKPLEPKVDGDPFQVKHIANEWAEVWEGFLSHIPNSRWINHPSNNYAASHKIEQLSRAKKTGLAVPHTLVTNNPQEARIFFHNQPNGVIVKPLSSGYIERDNPDKDSLIYTHAFNNLELLDDIKYCPVLFQERIDKKIDIRVTALDDILIAVGLSVQDSDGKQRLDVRRDNMRDVDYVPLDIPIKVRKCIHKLLQYYKLRFAAIDFAINNKDGSWVFFEINPNGQWAWLDLIGGLKIGEAFATLLREQSHRI